MELLGPRLISWVTAFLIIRNLERIDCSVQFRWIIIFNNHRGLDIKKALNDFQNWTNADFQKALPDENYQQTILGWVEQRQFIEWSLEVRIGDKN